MGLAQSYRVAHVRVCVYLLPSPLQPYMEFRPEDALCRMLLHLGVLIGEPCLQEAATLGSEHQRWRHFAATSKLYGFTHSSRHTKSLLRSE